MKRLYWLISILQSLAATRSTLANPTEANLEASPPTLILFPNLASTPEDKLPASLVTLKPSPPETNNSSLFFHQSKFKLNNRKSKLVGVGFGEKTFVKNLKTRLNLPPRKNWRLKPHQFSLRRAKSYLVVETPSKAKIINSFSVASFSPTSTSVAQLKENFTVFPIGLIIGKRSVIDSILVRGKEDENQVIDFENWLLPYNFIIQALKFSSKVLPDGQIELRSATLVTRINPKKLANDPQLGIVFSVQDLETLFGVKAKFNIIEYAIELDISTPTQSIATTPTTEPSIELEGLPNVSAANNTLLGIQQRVNANNSGNNSVNYQGGLAAVGTILEGSAFIRVDQPNIQRVNTWKIAEAQFLRQTDQADYITGSQQPFWRSKSSGEYWGFTTIQRQGFTPPEQYYTGGANISQRLQANQIGRTISGKAAPGTLVRLSKEFSNQVIAEVLVDSSGIYRFENIPVSSRFGGRYRVLLYPFGQLTATPKIFDATFSNLPGQIPAGATALVVSAGLRRRNTQSPSFFGEFSGFQGGVSQRRGVSEDLTVGLGGVYDEQLRGLGELFFKPKNFPVTVAVSALTGSSWDIISNIRFEPSRQIRANFNSDRFSSRFNVDWQLSPAFTLLGIYDSSKPFAVGGQLIFSSRNGFTFIRGTLDTQNRLRWNARQRLGSLSYTQTSNETGSNSELLYNFSGNSFLDSGYSLVLGYDTSNQNGSNKLVSLVGRYRSNTRSINGRYLWETQLGYGIGSQGSGLIASLGTAVLPGLLLQARYQGVSLTTGESSFNIELVSNLNLQGGVSPSNFPADDFRLRGNILVQAFFDDNNNGKHDSGEKFYTNPDLSLLNNQQITSFRPEVKANSIRINLLPGRYRLDIDPAGFPQDWTAKVNAYAVNVVAGGNTRVFVPLTKSYTISGVITDAKGQPLGGVRVEAIPANEGNERRISVSNNGGVYYIENLEQGTYTLKINDREAIPSTINIETSSPPFQELNLQPP